MMSSLGVALGLKSYSAKGRKYTRRADRGSEVSLRWKNCPVMNYIKASAGPLQPHGKSMVPGVSTGKTKRSTLDESINNNNIKSCD